MECSLLAGKPVVGLGRDIPKYEAVLGQLLGDCLNGGLQPFVRAWQKPEDCGEQRRGIQSVRVVVLAQDSTVADTMSEDVSLDFVCARGPFRLEPVVAADRRKLGGPVKSHPAHQLRRDVVL